MLTSLIQLFINPIQQSLGSRPSTWCHDIMPDASLSRSLALCQKTNKQDRYLTHTYNTTNGLLLPYMALYHVLRLTSFRYHDSSNSKYSTELQRIVSVSNDEVSIFYLRPRFPRIIFLARFSKQKHSAGRISWYISGITTTYFFMSKESILLRSKF